MGGTCGHRARLARLVVALLCAACVVPAAAAPADRMYVGFQDDQAFRWKDDRAAARDRARSAGAAVVRATVRCGDGSSSRPAARRDRFVSAYCFDDLYELVRGAQRRWIEVLLTIL